MTAERQSFASLYCTRHRLDPANFSQTIIRRTLHAPIRWVGGWLLKLNPDQFEADTALISHCGSLTSTRQLEHELREFNVDYRNRGFIRGRFRQRVSSRRLRQIFRETFRHGGQSTTPPIG
jgi:hypothetical protein